MNFNIYTRSFFKLYLELKTVCPFSFLTEIENISAGEEELRSYPWKLKDTKENHGPVLD